MNETHHSHRDCCEFPDLKRPRYFFGQLLGTREFTGEQSYFREKIKLLNRALHGYGVVCGLLVTPEMKEEDCGPSEPSQARQRIEEKIAEATKRAAELEKNAQTKSQGATLREDIENLRRELEQLPPDDCIPQPSPRLSVHCGFALDCEGNELILHRPATVDPLDFLSKDEREKLAATPGTIYVTICYCAKPIEPSRPLQMQECGITSDCEYGWTLDTVRLHVTTKKPEDKQHCNPCCQCDEHCLLLAEIAGFKPGEAISADQIHNGVRRALAVYDFVRIGGINWAHGAFYAPHQAKKLLGAPPDPDTDPRPPGLQIRLTRPILSSSLQRGVLDVWVLEGGGGRSANIYQLAGDFVVDPAKPLTDVITYQQRSEEELQDDDCVLIMLHCEFLLDECCRAVDGSHVGGRVPLLPESITPDVPAPPRSDCTDPTRVPGPWQSGNQTEGSNFVSWFFIRREKKAK